VADVILTPDVEAYHLQKDHRDSVVMWHDGGAATVDGFVDCTRNMQSADVVQAAKSISRTESDLEFDKPSVSSIRMTLGDSGGCRF
jgi:hypothetical protein